MADKGVAGLSHVGKYFTKDKPIIEIEAKEAEYSFPLKQHIGKQAIPVVKPGDKVKRGQLIAKEAKGLSICIHSSVDGTVIGIAKKVTVDGTMVDSIVVRGNKSSDMKKYIWTKTENYCTKQSPDGKFSKGMCELIDIVRSAGIMGMGGAGYPTYAKYALAAKKSIDYVIANGAECEPYLTADYRLMVEKPKNIVLGLCEIIRRLSDEKNITNVVKINKNYSKEQKAGRFKNDTGELSVKGIIALEKQNLNTSPRANDALEGVIRAGKITDIQVVTLPSIYPRGAEKILVKSVTGRQVDSGMLPSDVGCVVSNIHTVNAIYEAIAYRKPLIDRVITVSGDGVRYPGNYLVPIGVSCKDVLNEAGIIEESVTVIAGGPMMGHVIFSDETVITGSVNGLICIKGTLCNKEIKDSSCIRCGKCIEVCPMGLSPVNLVQCALSGAGKSFIKNGGKECMKCGSCSYVCPAGRELTAIIATFSKK